jgi:hypothetical protein
MAMAFDVAIGEILHKHSINASRPGPAQKRLEKQRETPLPSSKQGKAGPDMAGRGFIHVASEDELRIAQDNSLMEISVERNPLGVILREVILPLISGGVLLFYFASSAGIDFRQPPAEALRQINWNDQRYVLPLLIAALVAGGTIFGLVVSVAGLLRRPKITMMLDRVVLSGSFPSSEKDILTTQVSDIELWQYPWKHPYFAIRVTLEGGKVKSLVSIQTRKNVPPVLREIGGFLARALGKPLRESLYNPPKQIIPERDLPTFLKIRDAIKKPDSE